MTQQEYLAKLKARLTSYPQSFRDDIIDEFRRHFEEGIANGQSEEEIIDELGSVDDVMDNIRMMNGDFQQEKSFNDLQDSLSAIGSTIKDTVFTVTDSISEAVANARRNTVSGPLQSALDPFRKLKVNGVMDVEVFSGKAFSYRFTPIRSFLFPKEPVLDVIVSEDSAFFALMEGNGKLEIMIPDNLDSAEITTMSGDIRFTDVNASVLRLSTTSGDIFADHTSGSDALLAGRSGDIEGRNLSFSAIRTETTSGDILLAKSSEDIFVKSTSGDVEIRDCSASCVSVECTSGDADITCHSPTIEVTTTSGDIEIENDEPINSVICRTSSGDIDCRLYDTDYSASLKSGSGSIRNKTRLPEDKITKKEMLVGEGKGEVILSTVSGNIKLFD